MAMNFSTGKYKPQFPKKCINTRKYNTLPVFRSSWERKCFFELDTNANVIEWGSELPETVVEYYFSPEIMSGMRKKHRYYPDLYVVIKSRDGSTRKWLIEVKPNNDSVIPKKPKRKTAKAMRNYEAKLMVVQKNRDKWAAAVKWCDAHGITFKVFTEDTIFKSLGK